MLELQQLLHNFEGYEIALITINVLLLIFARPLFAVLWRDHMDEKPMQNRLHVFRAINFLIVTLLVFYHLFLPLSHVSWITKLIGVLLVLYLAHLAFDISNYFILQRFGKTREIEGKQRTSETYNTRALRILAAIFFTIIALISSIQILEFDSLLQAGGVIGFLGVLLALTQASWAPDIISGLIILNSDLMEEGDVIQFDDNDSMIGVVYKTKMFHTEILNMMNNHRVMIRNSRLRDHTIHNLSKFASAKGLRESLGFKISYECTAAEVRALFATVAELASNNDDIQCELQYELETRTIDAGDYAVEWRLFYYIKNVRNMLRTRQAMLELVLEQARVHHIELATPVLHHGVLPDESVAESSTHG